MLSSIHRLRENRIIRSLKIINRAFWSTAIALTAIAYVQWQRLASHREPFSAKFIINEHIGYFFFLMFPIFLFHRLFEERVQTRWPLSSKEGWKGILITLACSLTFILIYFSFIDIYMK